MVLRFHSIKKLGKRIYLTSTKQIDVKFTLIDNKTVSSCSCPGSTNVISACTPTKNGLEVTFSITKTLGGFCD